MKTKVRINLAEGNILDMYYNATLGKYSYALVKDDKRVLGWDNAPHHPDIKSHPHHFHFQNAVLESKMKGKPDKDINFVIKEINKLYER